MYQTTSTLYCLEKDKAQHYWIILADNLLSGRYMNLYRHLLDRPILAVFALDLMDCIFNIVDLPFQHSDLPLCGDWDFLKLTVRQNHRVIFSGGDFGNVAVAVFRGKILCGGYQKVCVGEKAVELCCPLAYQGIGNYKHCLVDRSQVLEVHPGGN